MKYSLLAALFALALGACSSGAGAPKSAGTNQDSEEQSAESSQTRAGVVGGTPGALDGNSDPQDEDKTTPVAVTSDDVLGTQCKEMWEVCCPKASAKTGQATSTCTSSADSIKASGKASTYEESCTQALASYVKAGIC